jgi:hypothetical protein
MKLTPKSEIFNLSLKDRRKIVYTLLEFCRINLGVKKKKTSLKVSVRNVDGAEFGHYSPTLNLIMINTFECDTLDMVTRTVIHEYTHYLQDMRSYFKLYRKHGYAEHPQEIEACDNELKYERRALNYLKKNLSL